MNEEEEDFIFVCRKCFSSVEIKDKKNHLKICKNNKDLEEFNFYLDNLNELFKDYKKVKKLNNKMLKKIDTLELKIKNETFKQSLISSLFTHLKETNIEDDIDLYKINNIEIAWGNKDKKESPKKKEHYISAQKLTDNIKQEKTEAEKKEIVQEVEKKLLEVSKKYYDEGKESIIEIIKEKFNLFEKDKVVEHLKIIKEKRPKLLKFLGYDGYLKLLDNHLKRLDNIINNKKMDNKSKKLYSNCFGVLDSRLLNLNCWNNEPISFEEIDRFHIGLERVKTEFEVFDIHYLLKNILTYDLALSSVKQILKRELNEKAGFFNIVFVIKTEENGKVIENNPNDPYSFYTLDKIEKKFRLWKMDCRLEEITHELRNHILKYCIEHFRRLYYLIFNDNTLREDYTSYSPVLELEAEQLVQNILIVSNFYKFNKMLKEIVKEHCFYTPTVMDKFHLYGDDKIQQKNFKKLAEDDYTPDLMDNLIELFDNPNESEIKEVFKNLFSQV